ncbi:very long-chain-fatty-acid--CoA ligase bubblegum-like isoform X4 [Chelonus insularis]|nr:very long-chain-fatty-acid--CoA ligase bubblegum-like isoform X4 [Chelonus insularis]XP_034940419.1 very long-chain-fatty-acid--CoA ligase bubblegum-like isoform X4 [Chelonus insularis]XP_034940420.1 very long-chain-fatty-acid--CoA ligase bubblegum-like isoform X4 [Chelonus insularis]XP_034940421.1 very long-chain-fatty-acid--CoA ligase bubblegum-like isoform X4 [Chelonus insularis]XP_034940422.1 very long-chain-fatty-acid--CoA ligase bubblegum-like isoform X4 [Chelonus insularis]
MSAVQPHIPNGYLNKFSQDEKVAPTKTSGNYFFPSLTGVDGPNQILPSDIDTTWEPNGRVRIKYDEDDKQSHQFISVPGLLMRSAKEYPNHTALVSRAGVDGNRRTYTYKEYESEVRTVAKAFLKLGLERYHSVCILGFNSPHWFIADLAAIYAGGFAAGIYTTNSPEACQYCAENSRANIIVVEDNKQLEKILAIRKDLPHLKAIIQYEGIATEKNVLSWYDLLEIGKAESDDKLDQVLRTIAANECCTLVYTSGTVGNPKAVMLSHDNLTFDARVITETIQFKEKSEIIVSFLPLSHVAAQVVDIFTSMSVGATVYFADKNALKGSLIETLTYARPTAFLGVPRVWEKIHEKMMIVARNNGPIKTWIATWAKAQGLYYNMNKMNGVDYKTWGYLFAKWLVFNKIKATLGLDRCRIFATAAAPLSDDIKKYFMSLDIPIMEAYGMSECAGAHTLSTENKYRLGSVGAALPGVKTKLCDPDNTGEGEICMGGRHVFMGYLNAPEKSKEAKDEHAWLHSGDLGRIDNKGLLYVTGRIKELVITAGGENIPPVHIEQMLLKELPALSNAMLIGDMKKYLTILVTLKTEMDPDTGEPSDKLLPTTISWAKSIGSKAKTLSEVLSSRDPAIYQEIENAIKRMNEHATSNAQKVQKFTILPHDFSIPTGELGPTLKLKRNVVVKKYADLIEEMYK